MISHGLPRLALIAFASATFVGRATQTDRSDGMMADSPVTFPKEGALPARFPPDLKEQSGPAEKDYYIFSSPCRSLAQIEAIQKQMPPGKFTAPRNDWSHLPRTRRILTAGGTLRLLALGDSIVNDTMRSGWVAKLEQAYPKAKVEAAVYVRGGGGCQHYRDDERVQKYILPRNPDLVLIGGISQRDLDSIRAVVHQLRAGLPEVEILLATGAFGTADPRDPKALAAASNSGTGAYGEKLRNLAAEERCAYLDMTTPWAEYIRSAGEHPHRFYRDAVHANEEGEQILSKILMAFWNPDNKTALAAQTLSLPPRSEGAVTGSELVRQLASLDLAAREQRLEAEILSGNVPGFLRRLCPVQLDGLVEGNTNSAVVYVTPDYLAVGRDEDYFLAPLSPATAQRIADACGCLLPTRKIVDAVYDSATLRLQPAPIAASPRMTSMSVFAEHNQLVWVQRRKGPSDSPLGVLVAGHKKDVVLSPKLAGFPDRVAIYGWHGTNREPIQPLYLGHSASWVDYSHGIRLVNSAATLNGQATNVAAVLSNPVLCGLLSDEGPLDTPRYATNHPMTKVQTLLPGFTTEREFNEQTITFTLEPEVRVQVNAPLGFSMNSTARLDLILYALPNGNTIEQTVGKALGPGDDWHFDIQHIGAQTRFLRERLYNDVVVVAYLEAATKSWPAWRKKHGDVSIPRIVGQVHAPFSNFTTRVTLTGHSGGGSFTFGYLNAVEQVPDDVSRIAFLDSTYAYDRDEGHADKLARWLTRPGEDHFLCVLAYDDARALLDGKPFVSAAGGTWGRSHAMHEDLARQFAFTSRSDAGFQRFSALGGRIQFILKENADRKILHTVQVERNGFIHAMLTGTALESRGYEYFGERAYGEWIAR